MNTDGPDESPKSRLRYQDSPIFLCGELKAKGDFLVIVASDIFANKEIQRLSRFLAVGAVGTLLDFSLLTLLKLAGLPTLSANSLSFVAGLINNFTWNRLWTFGDVENTNWRRQLMRFTVVSSIGLMLNNAIVLLLGPSSPF